MLKTWLLTLFFVSSVQASLQPPLCDPATSWKTVDAIESHSGETALLAGIAAYKNYAFAVGAAQILPSDTGAWVIRRSTDYGETWSTAKVLNGGGRGIAVDPRNGDLYSLGSFYESATDSHHQWVVQKSTDFGTTWTKLDDFYSDDHSYSSSRIIVDGQGNVMVLGQEYFNDGTSTPIIRRSENGAISWTNIFYAPKPFFANQFAASSDGKVIVAGVLQTPELSPIPNKWAVYYSPNGKTNWKMVDSLNGSSSIGSTATSVSIHQSGKILVAGNIGKEFDGPFRLMVRKSRFSCINKWSTELSYQPLHWRLGRGSASAFHIAFMTPTRFLINGRQRAAGSIIDENITLDKRLLSPLMISDQYMNPFTSPFQHEHVYTGGLTKLANGQALSGYIIDNETSKSWILRKMTCPL